MGNLKLVSHAVVRVNSCLTFESQGCRGTYWHVYKVTILLVFAKLLRASIWKLLIVIFEFKLEYSNLKFEYELEYFNLEFEYELEYSNSNSNIAISWFSDGRAHYSKLEYSNSYLNFKLEYSNLNSKIVTFDGRI